MHGSVIFTWIKIIVFVINNHNIDIDPSSRQIIMQQSVWV